jgi:phosphoribosylcarboxyaminoimidazole (NCAIR) mutase
VAGADPQGIIATAGRAAHLPAEPAMSLVPCTCIRSADLRSVVLPDPACPAADVHLAAGAVGS